VDERGYEVRHRAGRDIKPAIHAQQLSRRRLELSCGGVAFALVVADLGFRHRLQHGRGRLGYGIAP
jgi:hypothetical protein